MKKLFLWKGLPFSKNITPPYLNRNKLINHKPCHSLIPHDQVPNSVSANIKTKVVSTNVYGK